MRERESEKERGVQGAVAGGKRLSDYVMESQDENC